MPELLETGYRVRAMARTPDKLDNAPWRDQIEVVRGDLSDADSLKEAFADVDVVYYLVHSMGTARDFVAEERRAANNVVEAAKAAGVRRLIYLGGLHPAGQRLSRHLRSRTEVGDILLASGIETLVLQAGVVVGSGSASFEMIRHLTDRLPVMTTPKWVHNKIQPISIGDALHYLTAAASAEVPGSREWDIGGPHVLEYGDMMQIYAEVAGLSRRRMVVLPFLTPTIASWWVGLVTPIPPGLARPLVESLEVDAVMSNHDIDQVIAQPPGGLTGYRRAVERALDRTTTDDEPSRLRMGDPTWAGEVVFTDVRAVESNASPAALWDAVERGVATRDKWLVDGVEPGSSMRLRRSGGVGDMCLELSVDEHGGGSRYEQRGYFFPRGLIGQVYWYATRPLHALGYRRIADHVIGLAAEKPALKAS